MYFKAIQAAFYREGISMDEVLELSRRVASSYTSFVPQASKAVTHIVTSAVLFVFQVRNAHIYSDLSSQCNKNSTSSHDVSVSGRQSPCLFMHEMIYGGFAW